MPRQSAATRTRATRLALGLGAPAASKQAATAASSSPRSTRRSSPEFTTSREDCRLPFARRERSRKMPSATPANAARDGVSRLSHGDGAILCYCYLNRREGADRQSIDHALGIGYRFLVFLQDSR